jgi:hypothetical protein
MWRLVAKLGMFISREHLKRVRAIETMLFGIRHNGSKIEGERLITDAGLSESLQVTDSYLYY